VESIDSTTSTAHMSRSTRTRRRRGPCYRPVAAGSNASGCSACSWLIGSARAGADCR